MNMYNLELHTRTILFVPCFIVTALRMATSTIHIHSNKLAPNQAPTSSKCCIWDNKGNYYYTILQLQHLL